MTTELDILKHAHKFLRDDDDEEPTAWDEQLAKKYYDSLYREFAICDLKHYKSGNFALRWRSESEVLDRIGETSCANTRCRSSPTDLSTLELPFAYEEHGDQKEALVKVVLCPRCVRKLMWKRRQDDRTLHSLPMQDIHKSCRAIDALLAVLTDYCDLAAALAAMQKKLAKALKDAAGLKTNPQFAANAFGASAIILDALADTDSKFAKLAARESHSISADVKKWFKKLAKEEKSHDERMSESNARIKQAGQAYEKKSKKGAKDAGEEHARYIDLLSVIGPEMSQEKYKHALHVTEQHTLATFNVAASLARIADAEWSRTCESIRRVSPTIGSLGEWRSLCEGAWTGPLPDDLPDPSSESQAAAVSEWGQTGLSTPVRRSLPVPPSHSPGSVSVSAASLLDPPRSPFTSANQNQNQGSVNSITTLSAFPFPPTHFPVPLAMSEAELLRQQTQLQSLHAVHSRAGSPNPSQSHALAPPPTLSDSPKQTTAADLPLSLDAPGSSSSQMSESTQHTREPPGVDTLPDKALVVDPKKPRRPSLITRVPPPITRPISPFKRVERSSAENEFGVHTDNATFKSHSVDAAKKTLERTDSVHSAGNIVAALRNRYTQTVETPSQGPKDIPRLQMSVSEIASRYLSSDEPMSPHRIASPVVDRFTSDALVRTRELPTDENEVRRRKQRIEELAELELKEKEYELRQRERELNHRTRELERDRRQFLHSRPEPPSPADTPKGPRNSPFQHKRGSQSVTHVNIFSTSSVPPRPSTSHSPTRSQPLPIKDHAPFCGCDTCSVSKYKVSVVSPSPRDLRPPEPPIVLRPEKSRGWIRRLSMPSVNAAFSLDAKKNASAVSLKAGLPFPAENGRLRKRSYERGISNRTVTGIGR